MFLRWVIAFATTLVLEVPVYVWALRGRTSRARALAIAVGLNVATHPAAWLLTAGRSWPTFAAVEVAVWIVESSLLAVVARPPALTLREAAVVAMVANALSAGVGLLIG